MPFDYTRGFYGGMLEAPVFRALTTGVFYGSYLTGATGFLMLYTGVFFATFVRVFD